MPHPIDQRIPDDRLADAVRAVLGVDLDADLDEMHAALATIGEAGAAHALASILELCGVDVALETTP